MVCIIPQFLFFTQHLCALCTTGAWCTNIYQHQALAADSSEWHKEPVPSLVPYTGTQFTCVHLSLSHTHTHVSTRHQINTQALVSAWQQWLPLEGALCVSPGQVEAAVFQRSHHLLLLAVPALVPRVTRVASQHHRGPCPCRRTPWHDHPCINSQRV